MTMQYFNPADLVQHDATFNYLANSGVGFGLLPSNEQVFFSARMVERLALNPGDAVRVWAVDNYASPETSHFASRWRAVRAQVIARVEDVATVAPSTPNKPQKPAVPVADFAAMLDKMLEQDRPWSINELTHAIAKESVPLSSQPDLLQRVGTRLAAMHKTGDVACLKVYSKADNDRASAVYFAKTVDVFYDHLDTPLNDEEDE
jgi:hypothetical protein